MLLWVAVTGLANATEPCPKGMQRDSEAQSTCCWPGQVWSGASCTGIPKCPEGMRATPWGCHEGEAPKPRPQAEKRLVLFSGFGGQTLFLDGEEIGRLPTSVEVTLGEHTWHVVNIVGLEIGRGEFKARRGDDNNQIVVLERPPPEDEDPIQ